MARGFRRALLLVGLGFAINLAVAAVLARWPSWDSQWSASSRPFTDAELEWWSEHVSPVVWSLSEVHEARALGVRARILAHTPNFNTVAIRVTAGWPMQTIAGEAWGPGTAPQVWTETPALFIEPGLRYAIPFRPILPGAVLNTLLYATLLWLFPLRELRGALRVRRGRCPACAYPMGASPICSECGTALPLESRRGISL